MILKSLTRISLVFTIALIPLFASAEVGDSDNDGLNDVQERTVYFTDLENSDTDGNGFLDGDEKLF